MKKWKCTVCGYIHEGEEPPEKCPRCKSPKEVFVPYEGVAQDESDKVSGGLSYEGGDTVTDVLVVGTGAAAFCAAITAKSKGSEVVMIEKASKVGGTTKRSGGGFWTPGNRFQREAGYRDNKDDALRYMARYSYPNRYDTTKDKLGLNDHEFDLISSFYDSSSEMSEYLEDLKVFELMMGMSWTGEGYSDYAEFLPENKGIRGRLLFTKNEEGELGYGYNLIKRLKTWADENGITIITDCPATELIMKDDKVVGVWAEQNGERIRFLAKQGVMFGTGGYSHNPDLVQNFQPGPLYGGCAVTSNTGDFIYIAGKKGAKIGNTRGAFRTNSLVELHLADPNQISTVFMLPGDNSILVNKYGMRYVNERRNYNDRGKKHFDWDEMKAEYKNMLTFMIADHRTASLWQGNPPFPNEGGTQPEYLIKADSLDELADGIAEHLKNIGEHTGNFSLDQTFKDNLKETVRTFNKYAKDGKDPEFGRGENSYDIEWLYPPVGVEWPDKESENITMHPIEKPPYYAAIFGSGTLDTNGGPVIDGKARVLDWNDEPIDGLYGAGNCIAAPTADTYWGGGSTIGPALTFGYIAGKQLSSRKKEEPGS
ncbi:MAG TPA: FAD-dependent oxidoreductase [Candidatus Methanomethylophilaceae archaeon]|nr:FAD-dependent oxidoreductase [Candidatus Methanomethylophilaceae archaeon]